MKKNDLIEAVLVLFKKQGIKAVTMDAIAQHLKISKKTIYKQFNTKDSLVEGALDCFNLKVAALTNTITNKGQNACDEYQLCETLLVNKLQRIHVNFFNDINTCYPQFKPVFVNGLCTHIHGFIVANIKRGITEQLYTAPLKADLIAASYASIYRTIFSDHIHNMDDITQSLSFINNLLCNALTQETSLTAQNALVPLVRHT